jgi:thymidine kinase
MNLKLVDGLPVDEGATIELGQEEKYLPTCYRCYHTAIEKSRSARVAASLSV